MSDLPPPERPAPPPEEAPPVPPAPSDEGLLETALSVITSPVTTLGRVTAEARLRWAVTVAVAVAVLTGLAAGASLTATPVPADPAFPGGGLPAGLGTALAVMAAILAPIFALVGLVIGTAILHGTSLLLKGTGSFGGLFCGLAFAWIPSVLNVPAQLLPLALGEAGFVLSGLFGFGISLWVLVLGVVAVRENYGFSTPRAVAAVLIPVAVLFLLFLLFVLLMVLVVAGALLEGLPG